jgi:hypothetical protein
MLCHAVPCPCRCLQSKDWYDEEAVGSGLAASKIPRDQLFITSKVHPRDLGYNATLAAASRSLQKLRTTYLDLLLLHYPACFPGLYCRDVYRQYSTVLHDAVHGIVLCCLCCAVPSCSILTCSDIVGGVGLLY